MFLRNTKYKTTFKKKTSICVHMNTFKLLGTIENTREADCRGHTFGAWWDIIVKQKSLG